MLPEVGAHENAHPLQHAIADAVAVRPVDLREVVDVHQNHRQPVLEALDAVAFLEERDVEHGARVERRRARR